MHRPVGTFGLALVEHALTGEHPEGLANHIGLQRSLACLLVCPLRLSTDTFDLFLRIFGFWILGRFVGMG